MDNPGLGAGGLFSQAHSSGASHMATQMPVNYRLREFMRITGLSRPTLYRRFANNRFPHPIHLGGRDV